MEKIAFIYRQYKDEKAFLWVVHTLPEFNMCLDRVNGCCGPCEG